MTSKNVVPGVGTNTQKAPRTTKPRAAKKTSLPVAEHSDLRPRTSTDVVQQPVGIDPTKLTSHMDNLEEEIRTRYINLRPMFNNREELIQALQELGLTPRVDASPITSSVMQPAPVETAHVPSLVSQGLVNVLMQVRQMPTQLVEAKLDDLAGILNLRKGAVTPEARQRYTLMACVQIVQDFEQLWATPAALQR